MKKLICVGLALLGMSGVGEAAQLKEGATACRNHKALLEIQAAEKAGDQRTMEWLFNGAACIKIPAGTEVSVIAGAEDGSRRLRTLNMRRNIELWVTRDQLEVI